MKHTIFTTLLFFPALIFGQIIFPFSTTEPSGEPDIFYYKFYNGIQMIELDYLSAYHRRVNYLEQTQPRALTWEMVIGPPQPNLYLFRNENGAIVKPTGNFSNLNLLSVQESLKIAKTHNAIETQFGAVFGFSSITTRYFPYYLIGSQFDATLGLIDSFGNEVVPSKYSEILAGENLFITGIGETFELRDKHLKIKYTCYACYMLPAQFNNGYVDIWEGDNVGLMDSTGKIVVPCLYSMVIDGFNEYGLAKVYKNGLIGFVDSTGKEVIKCKYQSVGYFKEGLLDVRINQKWGYIDVKGKTIIPHQYDIGIWFEEGLARVAKQENGQYLFGYIDKKGNEVIPLVYKDAKDFSNGIAEVMVDGKWLKIDKMGNPVD